MRHHTNRWFCLACDLDGTLVDSLPALRRAYEAFLGHYGRSGNAEEFARLNGPSLTEIIRLLKQWHGLPAAEEVLLSEYKRAVTKVYDREVVPATGAEALLEHARRTGHGRALVTSSPRAVVTQLLDRFGWREHFDVIVCGDEVSSAKPNPAIYSRACALGGWRSADCLAVEDAPAGVRSAREAGLNVVGVGPIERHPELHRTGAAWACTSLEEVRGLLGKLEADHAAAARC